MAIVPSSSYHIDNADISEHSLDVASKLQQAGHTAYLVGGCVRDLLLNIKPKDFDIATSATPEEVNNLFKHSRLIGRRFRLVHVYFGRDIIEVATFRAHSSDTAQHEAGMILQDNCYGTLEEDVWRRDFTMNALYYDPISETLIDHTNGLEAIQQKTIRVIGDPKTRYREDPVRMLRALRFAAKLGFTLEESCASLIYEQIELLDHVPPARLLDEVIKMFHFGHAVAAFEILEKYQLLENLFPQTAKAMAGKQGDKCRKMIMSMLTNTDLRISQQKPVTPAFLFINFLWHPFKTQQNVERDAGHRGAIAFERALHMVLQQQRERTVIPKRFSHMIQSVWRMQRQLCARKRYQPRRVLTHPKFRAAYDFLLLRSEIGEVSEELATWWTDFQEASDDVQQQMLEAL